MNPDDLSLYRKRVTTQSDNELFIQKITNPEDDRLELSPALQLKLDRMYMCKALIDKKISRARVIVPLMNEAGVSRAEAHRIYTDTIEVFEVTDEPKGRNILIGILYGNIAEARAKALAAGEFKNVIAADKLLLEAIKEFSGGYEADKYKNVQPPNITFVYAPQSLNVVQQRNLDEDVAMLLKSKNRNNEVFDQGEIIKPDDSTGATA